MRIGPSVWRTASRWMGFSDSRRGDCVSAGTPPIVGGGADCPRGRQAEGHPLREPFDGTGKRIRARTYPQDKGGAMRTKMYVGLLVTVAMLAAGCSSGKTVGNNGGFSTSAALPGSSPSTTPASGAPATGPIAVTLGETDPTHMFINMSATSAVAGKVTFLVSNTGSRTHEFVVLATATPAGAFPIVSFEGEKDRIDEDAPGVTNVGETGDMKAGQTKALTIDMTAGHYAVVCNLPGHYRMGMHQDFTVVPGPGKVVVGLGQTDPMHMFIHPSATQAPSGKVTFVVTNQDTITHEFVVLKTDTAAASFPIGSFE